VTLVGVEPGDAAIEIGPGMGQLTRPLAAVARRTVALEIDRGLVRLLAEEGELPASVEVRCADALEVDLRALARELGPPVVLLGNLPYRVAGRLLAGVLGPDLRFRRMGFMVQAEMADRLLARPGTPEYGTLSVYARLWARAERALELSPEEFSPRPKVRSTFVVLTPLAGVVPAVEPEAVRRLVRAVFQQRRKQLKRALAAAFAGAAGALERAGIDPQRRGETLDEGEFARLAAELARGSALTDPPDRP
jgi:16S rRNA (adenine1518-N6/adenine1519-N6)-dimethyltransferase